MSHKNLKKACVCDINEEIISKKNSYFVLHDSQGFEHNEISNLDKVKKFIRSRSGELSLLKTEFMPFGERSILFGAL